MKLTPHFSLEEFTRSSTAQSRGIDNSLTAGNTAHAGIIANLKALCRDVLEPLREYIGKPLVVTSGYRCPQLNRCVGGVANSQHMTGEAADLRIPDIKQARRWMEWMADELAFDQLILEHRRNKDGTTTHWLHISYSRHKNRQAVIGSLWKT